jgi:hypothetical protein
MSSELLKMADLMAKTRSMMNQSYVELIDLEFSELLTAIGYNSNTEISKIDIK